MSPHNVRKHLMIGPGGMRCSCCFPPRGSKARKGEYRRAKLRERREAMRIEEQSTA